MFMARLRAAVLRRLLFSGERPREVPAAPKEEENAAASPEPGEREISDGMPEAPSPRGGVAESGEEARARSCSRE
jgi:hypothetical protein